MVIPLTSGAIIARAVAAARSTYAAGLAGGSFDEALLSNRSGDKGMLELTNLNALERELRAIGPQMLRDFRKNAKKLGNPAARDVRKAFKSAGLYGPLGAPKPKLGRKGRTYDRMYTPQNGRLSWTAATSMRTAIDVNYKNRKHGKALAKLKAAEDGTVSIVRIRVKGPAFVVADMAGKSGKKTRTTGTLSREYSINRYGRGVRNEQRHRINRDNVQNWLDSLDRKGQGSSGEPSRYAYPALIKHSPKFKSNTQQLLQTTISTINRRLES